MKQLELSLNWVCDAIENLLSSAQVHVHGRELVAIIGKGDNWEAAYVWLESLDVNEDTYLDDNRRQFTDVILSSALLPLHISG